MSTQQIVDPALIEKQLQIIWEGLAKENKMRASLFNLIVYNNLSPRTDYIRNIVQKIIEKFPCRVLFITFDPDPAQSYLKTAISVVAQPGSETTACDYIDIGVAGTDWERVPFLILPHIIPDLPVYLLWTEDPSRSHPLFDPLLSLAHRAIFDSESADQLLSFSKTLLELYEKRKIDIADLNWARTEGWRDLFASTFDSPERVGQLQKFQKIEITYNACPTEFFCHLKIQSMYLAGWLASQLDWKFSHSEHKEEEFLLLFEREKIQAQVSIRPDCWKRLGPGTLISAHVFCEGSYTYICGRIPQQYHHVSIQVSSPHQCDLPYYFVLGQTATGQSLVQEICTKGTSAHYLATLRELQIIDQDNVC